MKIIKSIVSVVLGVLGVLLLKTGSHASARDHGNYPIIVIIVGIIFIAIAIIIWFGKKRENE